MLSTHKIQIILWGIIPLLVLFFSKSESIAQTKSEYFKFPVIETGIVKISQSQIKNMGFDNLEEVAVYGYPGMLPQKLDSTQLQLQEIPSQIIGNEFFCFLNGPHQIFFDVENVQYQHHIYTDTLYYLIGKKSEGKIVKQSENTTYDSLSQNKLYQIQFQKWETSNLLSSGRKWYSEQIFNGRTFVVSFDLPKAIAEEKLKIQLGLMAQSLGESNFRINSGGQTIGEISISAIPNSTYGIKGRESVADLSVSGNAGQKLTISVNYQSSDINGVGYLDYALLTIPQAIPTLESGIYYNLQNGGGFTLPENKKAWKISDFYEVEEVTGNAFLAKGEKIVLFDPTQVPLVSTPTLANTGLRDGNDKPSLIIVTNKALLLQAQRLASHKNEMGIPSSVAVLEDIYDAYGYGSRDISAIRNFIAHRYHGTASLKNVLFFGKGTYDYKAKQGGRPNIVPTYSSRNSLNPLTTFSSDDFFGLVDWGQGQWEETNAGDELLQIGIGRIPAISSLEAKRMVDKIIAYEIGTNNRGEWKRNIAFFADDADNNIHLRDAETHAAYLSTNHPEYLIKKLYLDKYPQVKNGNSQSSPVAKEALKSTLEEGVLILNYIGHGNENVLTAERVFEIPDLYDWPENPFLPLIVTATCEFGRHDSPFIRSGAEEFLFAENKGAIGMLTTGRPVFSSVNFALNTAFISAVFVKENGENSDIGKVFRQTKNNSLNGPFNRNFSLLGDPSMKLAVPDLITQTEQIWDIDLEIASDTLRSLQRVQITGKIIDPLTGAFLPNKQGEYAIQISDKPEILTSLGDESSPAEYLDEVNVLFNGKGQVKDGSFTGEVFIPKKEDLSVGIGNIRLFATFANEMDEAIGALKIPIGGASSLGIADNVGPQIKILYGQNPVEGNRTFPFTSLPIKLLFEDKSGINISSKTTGQDIVLQINDQSPMILNRSYQALNGGFEKGELLAMLSELIEGKNTITVSAWDNAGNRSEITEEIEIRGSLKLEILELTAYPNPASESSKFKIAHNRPNETLNLELKVYSVLGSEIFSISRRYVEADFLLEGLEWNFFRSTTKYPVKGTYIYTLLLSSEKDNSSETKSGKIIIQ